MPTSHVPANSALQRGELGLCQRALQTGPCRVGVGLAALRGSWSRQTPQSRFGGGHVLRVGSEINLQDRESRESLQGLGSRKRRCRQAQERTRLASSRSFAFPAPTSTEQP